MVGVSSSGLFGRKGKPVSKLGDLLTESRYPGPCCAEDPTHLSVAEGAEPPSLNALRVLLDDSKDVALLKGQFVRCVGIIIVNGLGIKFLQINQGESIKI